jgi:hypothetical protein
MFSVASGRMGLFRLSSNNSVNQGTVMCWLAFAHPFRE